MAGDIQAVLNSQTAGVSDIHAWGLMLPSSSRVSPHHIPLSRCGQIPRPLQTHKQRLGTGQLRFRRNPSRPQDSNSCSGTPMPESTVWSRLMGGDYIQHWSFPPTYQAPKKHQSVMLKPPHTALQAQNHSGRRKKRRVTSSLPLRRTKRKMDPALAGQPSVHVNI